MALNRKGTRREIFVRHSHEQNIVLNASLVTKLWDTPPAPPKPTSGRVWRAGGLKYVR